MRVKTWHGILLLTLLALLSWHFSRGPLDTDATLVGLPDIRLNYAVYELKGRLLDDQGMVKIDIASPVLRNDAESGIGTIESPEIHIQEEKDHWYITAESAIISADREIVTLSGQVNLSRLDQLTDQTLQIETSDVVLNVTPRTAMSDAPVSMQQQSDRLDAVGMTLDMVNKRYELLNDVRAHYETR
ncbi:MAG TPA: LPS export ABC transporter periplasmic protein LptC [Xanthomonadales bacterium]|nr:LPS export ABC transporter periplasmic protein LptC [Xanthomonadales bacterium]